MSDSVNKPSEAGAGDASKFVPKEDFEKLANDKKELESKLDEAKLSLLDPDYIDFLETKKGKQVEKVIKEASTLTDKEMEGLTSKQILELATERAIEAVTSQLTPKYEEALRKQGATLQDILAYIELGEVEKKYKDFDTYRDDVKKVLENSRTQISIEQAYKQAKYDRLEKEDKLTPEDKKTLKTPPPIEKPTSSVPGNTMSKSAFKTSEEAAKDAWDKVVGSGKDSL